MLAQSSQWKVPALDKRFRNFNLHAREQQTFELYMELQIVNECVSSGQDLFCVFLSVELQIESHDWPTMSMAHSWKPIQKYKTLTI